MAYNGRFDVLFLFKESHSAFLFTAVGISNLNFDFVHSIWIDKIFHNDSYRLCMLEF